MKNPTRMKLTIILLMIGGLFLIVAQQAVSSFHDNKVQPYEVSGPPEFSQSPEPSIVSENGVLAPYLPENELEKLLVQTKADWQYVGDLKSAKYKTLDSASIARIDTVKANFGEITDAKYTKIALQDISDNSATTTIGTVYTLASGQDQFVQYIFSYEKITGRADWKLREINSSLTQDADNVSSGRFSPTDSTNSTNSGSTPSYPPGDTSVVPAQ